MDTELKARLDAQDVKIEEIRQAVVTMKRYMQITFWVTVVLFVLPLFALVYAVPKAMNSYLGAMNIDTFDLQGL